jgi:hypothetical protein
MDLWLCSLPRYLHRCPFLSLFLLPVPWLASSTYERHWFGSNATLIHAVLFSFSYGDRIRTALPGAMNDDFGRVIQVQMEYFSNNPNADKITKVKEQIDEVTNIMVQNIGTAIYFFAYFVLCPLFLLLWCLL